MRNGNSYTNTKSRTNHKEVRQATLDLALMVQDVVAEVVGRRSSNIPTTPSPVRCASCNRTL